MKIFNTLSRRKEEFVPIEPGKVKICLLYTSDAADEL